MTYRVSITEDAERDLEDIHEYIRRTQGDLPANHVVDKIVERLKGLSGMPSRGVYPKELLLLGYKDYREIFFKPYRIIYRVIQDQVIVILITDGRRDMRTLLQRRLLE